MGSKERFVGVLKFELTNTLSLPCLFYQIHGEAIRRWQREGLPKDVHVIEHLGLERAELMPVDVGPMPHYERGRLEEIEEWRLSMDRDFKAKISEEITVVEEQPPIRQPSDWEWFKRLLNPQSPARYPRFWDDYKRVVSERTYALGIYVGSPLSWLIEWLSVRGFSEALNSNRQWLDELIEWLSNFVVETTRRAVSDITIDFAMFMEGRAYRAVAAVGSDVICSLVRKSYEMIVSHLHQHGIRLIIMHAGGNVAPLIPMWLDVGINALAPIQASAGMDVISLRKTYGKDLALIGGIDREALAGSKRDVADEVLLKVPSLLNDGGYIPAPDGVVQANVAWENMCYYLELLHHIAET
ncbi:MAG: uroporphyrinogen decarboxylase family protein [Armatimonadota bacterium]|nr:uroporphyrinogen decarboxylase family protein [Armatimonadota bacterium]MCX7778164.1 uroporphyrinogen decarboxylase family protein [Armatimonadota bacterium]MDW8026184.1 uroporphyrinogen decarboxylase family protein [Armatimonadota bacterium]